MKGLTVFIARRRFNYIDATTIGATSVLLSEGRWGWMVIAMLVGSLLSVILESH